MEYKDCSSPSHRVHRPKGITAKILDHFYYGRSTEASQSFRIVMLPAALRKVKCITDMVLNRIWEFAQIFPARANPDYRSVRRFAGHGQIQYGEFTISDSLLRQQQRPALQFGQQLIYLIRLL